MKTEDQVCSLEYAIKFKQLGFIQESDFFWHKDADWRLDFCSELMIRQHENYSAFTVAELGEMLPKGTLVTNVDKKIWAVYSNLMTANINIIDETEANARAKMLIYIIEKGIADVSKLKC